MILLIDNYDSFVHNLARYFNRLGQETKVVRNDAHDVNELMRPKPRALVVSPGPCTPNESGSSVPAIQQFADAIPILGICLGHQAIAAAFGGEVTRAIRPVHGRIGRIHHAGAGILANLPDPFPAARYHSLVVKEDPFPSTLEVTARCDAGQIMALQHRSRPVFGLQFHPESILTDHGYELLANFLDIAGLRRCRIPSGEKRGDHQPAAPESALAIGVSPEAWMAHDQIDSTDSNASGQASGSKSRSSPQVERKEHPCR